MNLISIIITTCRGSVKLRRAVKSAIMQTYENIEIIVIDDNGRGTKEQVNTEKLLAPFIENKQIKYIVHTINKNGAAARNTGIANAQGKYLAFLDDDDFFLPRRCEVLARALEENNVNLVYSDVIFIANNKIVGSRFIERNGFKQADILKDTKTIGTGSNLFMLKSVADKINGFDENFRRYQDVEFIVRALSEFKIVGVREFLVVKDVTDCRFYPKFEQLLEIQNRLFDVFKEYINKMSYKERRDCYLNNRKTLLWLAYQENEFTNICQAWDLINKDIPDLKTKEKVKIRVKYFLTRHTILHKFLQKMKRTKNGKWLIRLPKSTLKEIYDLIDA